MEKTVRDFLHPGGGESLAEVERKADETLHAYLLRCQSELTGRVMLLAAARDGYLTVLGRVRASSRRRMILLTFAGPILAALAYTVLALSGIAASLPIPVMAGLIACAGLAGSALAIGIARAIGRIPDWKAARLKRRWG